MSRPRARIDYDTAARADPYDAWVTITVTVVAIVLSVQRFRGSDFDFLIADPAALPRETWRHASSALLHGDWLHLGFNAYWTMKFGVLLEALLGGPLLAVVVLVLAWTSGAAEWAFGGPSVGLSGVGYGLFALLWALDRWHPRCRGVLDRQVTEMFGIWFVICLAADYYDAMPIANVAHGAGALLGGLIGWSLAARSPSGRGVRSAAVFATVALVGVLSSTELREAVNPRARVLAWMADPDRRDDPPGPGALRAALPSSEPVKELEPFWRWMAEVYREARREDWAERAEELAREAASAPAAPDSAGSRLPALPRMPGRDE